MEKGQEREKAGKARLVLFVKKGLDSLIDEVIAALFGHFETKKVVVSAAGQIDAGMKWADVCWFEWCDELVAYASRHPLAAQKKIVCRLHGFETFTQYPAKVDWEAVDLTICVAPHIRDHLTEKTNVDPEKTAIIPIAVDTDRYSFRKRAPGPKLAWAGYINYKKGPMLLLHTFKAMHDADPKYELHIAGVFQDQRDLIYFRQMTGEWGIEDSVFFEGWQEDLDAWLEDKDFILCTSLTESQNLTVMQAMAKGIKPIIHNFVGAREIYPGHLVFNGIQEAVAMLSGPYDSEAYREYIRSRYGRETTAGLIVDAMRGLAGSGPKMPLVSVVMAVYNRERYLLNAMESVLSQSYPNIELIVVDDDSTDGSKTVAGGVRDPRVRFFSKEHTGRLDTLRYGFMKARGRYVTRVDSDDGIHPEYVAACVEAMSLDASLDFVYPDFLTVDEKGEAVGEIRFKDYDSPMRLILDVFTTFASVIPDTAFWKREYMEQVVFNQAEQNVPFYIDNIIECRYGHIKSPMYRYRQHDANYALQPGSLRTIMEGKISFIDLLIKKYFIQMDITQEFMENRREYFKLFAQYFTVLADAYVNAGEEIKGLFMKEASFWRSFAEPEGGAYDAAALNIRVLIASSDGPGEARAAEAKRTHIALLTAALTESGVPCFLAAYALDSVTAVDTRLLLKEWQEATGELLSETDSAFAYLVYAVQKQLERKIEQRLKRTFVSHIGCQDVLAVHAARSALSRLNMDIPVVLTLHERFAPDNADSGLVDEGSAVHRFFGEYEKTAYAAADRIIAVDEGIKRYVLEFSGGFAQKTSVLKNAVDDVYFKSGKDDTEHIYGNLVFVPGRGAARAIRAAKELLKRGVTNFRLAIAGRGDGCATENGLPDCAVFLGDVSQERMLAHYRAAKAVAVFPGGDYGENAMPALEAMACARAVIACGEGAFGDIIDDGVNGFLVPVEDPAAAADAIARVLDMDEGAYLALGKNARKTVEERYGHRRHAKRYVEVLEACYRETTSPKKAR